MSTFGRTGELAALRRALTDTAAGAGGCVVLSGAPGVGKSHLVRVAIEMASEFGIAVAAREAFKLDVAAPLVTLAGALRACKSATSLFDWLFDGSRREEQYHTIDRLRAALEDFAADRPLLIVVDDAQWTDELSALAVRELVPALASSPVRWLFAGRPETTDTPGLQMLTWLGRGRAEPITVGVLDEPAIAQLSAAVVGAEVDNTVLALAGGCGGNPLRVGQLMRALRASGQIVFNHGTASVIGGELPSSFVDTVADVLASLSEDTQRLLRACSVFGRPFGIEAAARLTAREPAEVYGQVEEALTDLLTDDGGGLTFAHDLVRQAIYNTLPRLMREQLHRDAAAIARAEGRPAMEVAEHLRASGSTGTAAAVAMLRAAARDVAAAAPATAADLMTQALQVLGEHGPDRTAVIAEAVGVLAAAGRVSQARNLGEQALDAGLSAEHEAGLLLGLAEACKHSGQNASAVEYATRGLCHNAITDALRARLHAIRAHARFYVDDLTGADESGAAAERLGTAGDEHAAAVFGGTARSLVALAEGRMADALSHASVAVRIAEHRGGRARQQHPGIWLGNALTAFDRFDEAEEAIRRGRRESERLGTAWANPLWHYYYANLLGARGRLDDAVAEAEAGVTTAEQVTSAYQLAVPLLGTLARLAVLRGDLDAAQAHLDRMHELMRTGITAPPEDVIWPECLLLHAGGASDVAFSVASGFYESLATRPALIILDPSAPGLLTRIALTAGDRERAARVASAARTLATRNPQSQSAAGAAAHAEGLLHDDPARLADAAEHFGRTPRALALAAALQDAGANPQPPRPTGTPAAAPILAGLSPAELKVALLVAEGLTNIQVAEKLFLSRHTVDSHLRHIFTKLAIKRRVELAKVVAANRAGT
ncbi:AAA family ATPase [Actinoplanes sp. TFC3]|uniref:ATP-binding protein n=1 Tax=Actinoplanes sp. TFC3 TaxID=1710355 RepID=UPI00082BA984|nr:LuxR family transcriptional regulator [Actinoplanes sp. TFC3]